MFFFFFFFWSLHCRTTKISDESSYEDHTSKKKVYDPWMKTERMHYETLHIGPNACNFFSIPAFIFPAV